MNKVRLRLKMTISSTDRVFTINIPKDEVTSSLKYFYGAGGYFTAQAYFATFIYLNNSTVDTCRIDYNGTATRITDITYYYD